LWSSSADPAATAAPRAVAARTLLTGLPEAGPIDDAALLLAGRRILDAGPRRRVLRGFNGPVDDLGEAVLMPGLINAHAHLELSGLRDLCPRPAGFPAWAAWLVAQDRSPPDAAVLDQAVAELAATGTGAVIDIGSGDGLAVAAALRRTGLAGLVCREAFGWRRPNRPLDTAALDAVCPDASLRAALSGHALYSTHPETLRRVRQDCLVRGAPFCLHLAEHAAETELLATGMGPLADMLVGRVLPCDYAPPGRSPVAEAVRLGLLGPSTLAVHAVWLDTADRTMLAEAGAAVCLCPRSNARIGVGVADAPALLRAGVPLCLGTDSLASNDDLDLWNEARALWAAFPDFPGREMLAALTTTPARLLGRVGELGCLAAGAVGGFTVIPEDLRPRLLARR
jgi:cytosine/adenosine deaminase-related metal-dependent hydrolase